MLTVPYNFVPLSSKVFYPDWADKVSQDIPFGDGEDGVIELTVRNMTPLFVKNGNVKDAKEEYSSYVSVDGKKKYFIPGTTLKGCFRSVMEILSFGKMQMYNDDSFGIPREFGKGNPNADHYKNLMKDVSCGWLYKRGEEYYISECTKGVQTIKHEDIKTAFKSFKKGDIEEKGRASAEVKQTSLGKDLYPIYSRNEVSYQIICTGYMKGKENDYLFSIDQFPEIEVDKEVVKAFESVHRNTEYYGGKNGKGGFLKKRLHMGEPIPVFFTSKDGAVTAMGITRMFRYPYPNKVSDAVNSNYNESVNYKKRDLPETIFGYIDGSNAMKGRVSFTHAFAEEEIKDDALIHMEGVLGQPSSSYYPLYLKQDNAPYKSYKDKGVKIAGRKRYRITKDGEYIELSAGNGNENVLTKINALPAGQTFKSRIVFHNLRPVEIGALISAITMNGTDGVYHNIGMAKSFGLGKISCGIELCGLEKSKDEYLRAFEYELTNAGISMANESCLNRLVEIASPTHTKEEMAFMELSQYNDEKKGNSILKETWPKKIHTEMSAEEFFKAQQEKNAAADKAEIEKIQQEAEAERQRIAAVDAAEKAAQAEKEAEIKANRDAKYSVPFAEVLNKTDNPRNIASELVKWIKVDGNDAGETEYKQLVEFLRTKDQKDVKNILGGKLKDYTKVLGKAFAESLYKEFGIKH